MKRYLSFIFVLMLAVANATPVSAETTGWFKGKEKAQYFKKISGHLVTKIECRDGKSTSVNVFNDEYRVTYVPNPKKVRYLWSVGNAYSKYAAKAKREGYRLVSLKSYVRKSGLRMRCAVWHKP